MESSERSLDVKLLKPKSYDWAEKYRPLRMIIEILRQQFFLIVKKYSVW